MPTMTPHDETVTRPEWPAQTTRTDDAIDLRDRRDARDEQVAWSDEREDRRPRRGAMALRVFGFVVAAVLLGAIALVAGVNNADDVRIDAVFDTFRAPIWAIIGMAGVFGFVAGRMLDDRGT